MRAGTEALIIIDVQRTVDGYDDFAARASKPPAPRIA